MRPSLWRLSVRSFGSSVPVRTRFAPSPTGFMHLGGLRTALFNFLIAKKTGGRFLLRIEDTDQSRTVPGAIDSIQEVLQWTGIGSDADEPVIVQSSRLPVYRRNAEELVSQGRAYRCYCSKERLDTLREASRSGYDRACRNKEHGNDGRPHVIRLRVPDDGQRIAFQDQVYGHIVLNASELDDVILMKGDGFPTYHFANVIDDHESRINLVMRGQEWLPSTPLHVLLYDMFRWSRPAFAHLPLLVKGDGTKLSKRHGDAFVQHYRYLGYLPEALVNFVAFLGWSPRAGLKEVMGLEELAEAFALGDINKAESRVDISKLNWLNRRHLGLVEPQRLVKELRQLLESQPDLRSAGFNPRVYSDEYLAQVIGLIKDRIHLLSDIPRLCSYFFKTPMAPGKDQLGDIDHGAFVSISSSLSTALVASSFDSELAKRAIAVVKKEHSELSSATVMMAIRLAVTGTSVGASVIQTMVLLGREECLHRLHNCINTT